ncbi:transcription elongation factor [Vibrio sp. 10N.286.49.B3]|uniref:GreA/GreB family elongation factor n=1 Tax=Vibrio sp. 10N.286.49.B3 TaxID=1880855 RepID=UPI000C828002|nr:GreA/GreB family elongation factor [Vibrio sp. 10N.286.49.B3]PMH41137.1 transcription elongation factor [Vibrio sp. 10N.286.49.B3]
MNKSDLRQIILQKLTEKHRIALAATQTAIDDATDDETIPDNKYDTLALEAAYLAHGQGQRVLDCEQDIRHFNDLVLRDFSNDEPIAMSALVELIDNNDVEHWFFMGPSSGGIAVEFMQNRVSILTFQSPLGQALRGKCVGDEVEIMIGTNQKYYEVISIN